MIKNKRKVKKIWFRAKEYGWGWYPISWQGWLSIVVFLLLYIIILIWLIKQIKIFNIIFGVLIILILLVILLLVCYKKGEKPGWRWHGKLLNSRGNKK